MTDTASQSGALMSDAVLPDKHQDKKRERTRGEKTFDGLVYGGINWIVNTVLSAALTFKVVESDSGKRAMEGLDRTFAAMSGRTHVPGKPGGAAKGVFTVGTLFGGGTLLLIPIRYLEGKKGSIVRWLDDKLGNGSKPPEEIADLHKQMDELPKQTATSLLEGRGVVLGLGLGLNATAGKQMGAAGEMLGKVVSDTLAPQSKPKWGPFKRDTLHKVSSLLMIDLIIGAFTTLVFYVSSRVFAKHIEQRKEDRQLARDYRNEHHAFDQEPALTTPDTKSAPESPGTLVQHVEKAPDAKLMPAPELALQQARA